MVNILGGNGYFFHNTALFRNFSGFPISTTIFLLFLPQKTYFTSSDLSLMTLLASWSHNFCPSLHQRSAYYTEAQSN